MWPNLTPDFIEKLWLSVIDKVALGTVVLVVGFFINRRLEGIKSREGVRKALLERRVTAILDRWDAVRHFRWDTVDFGADAWMGERHPSAVTGEEPARAAVAPGDAPGLLLVQRGHALRKEIRDHRGLLGKTIADAMYAAVAVDLDAAKAFCAGQGPEGFPPESPDFEWLEQLLDAPDMEELPLIAREETLAASRVDFLRRWKQTRAVAASASTGRELQDSVPGA